MLMDLLLLVLALLPLAPLGFLERESETTPNQ